MERPLTDVRHSIGNDNVAIHAVDKCLAVPCQEKAGNRLVLRIVVRNGKGCQTTASIKHHVINARYAVANSYGSEATAV